VHLASLGHPLVGDKLYVDDGAAFLKRWDGSLGEADIARLGLPRHALHAWTLGFAHPMTGEMLALRAPVPTDLLAFAAARGGSAPGEAR
jgi:23S rRNA pseudouridine1911/1915/1917 synthase